MKRQADLIRDRACANTSAAPVLHVGLAVDVAVDMDVYLAVNAYTRVYACMCLRLRLRLLYAMDVDVGVAGRGIVY